MPPAITPEQRAWEPEQPLPHAQTNTLDDELLEMDEVAPTLAHAPTLALAPTLAPTLALALALALPL